MKCFELLIFERTKMSTLLQMHQLRKKSRKKNSLFKEMFQKHTHTDTLAF